MSNNKFKIFTFITLFSLMFVFGGIKVNAKGVNCVYTTSGGSDINVTYRGNNNFDVNCDSIRIDKTYFKDDDFQSDGNDSYLCPSVLYYRLVTISSRENAWELSFKTSRIEMDKHKNENIVYKLNIPLSSTKTVSDDEPQGGTTGGNQDGGTKINTVPITCDDFKYGADSVIDELFTLIMIIGPILVIVLSSVDFAKASLAGDESAVKKAGNRFGKRLIAAALLFLLPLIINFILSIATDAGIFSEIPDTCIDQNY